MIRRLRGHMRSPRMMSKKPDSALSSLFTNGRQMQKSLVVARITKLRMEEGVKSLILGCQVFS